jgi:hypothetical protein
VQSSAREIVDQRRAASSAAASALMLEAVGLGVDEGQDLRQLVACLLERGQAVHDGP